MNKIKFESAVLDQIHEHVLSRTNVLQYIELATAAPGRKHEPSAEESAARAALADADAKLRRWEEALERGLLSLEDAAERIRAVRQQRADVLKTQSRLERQSRSRSEIRTIPTPLMEAYIETVRKRLREKAIFAKREFLAEIIKEIRVRDKQVTLTYRLPWMPKVFAQKGRGGSSLQYRRWWSQ